MRILVSIVLVLWAGIATADSVAPPLPALYGVTGVAADDRLNIRSLPDASADIIGTLGPTEDNLEIVAFSLQGNWAMLNTAERSGWVSLQFLAPQPAQTGSYGLPAGLQCFGTEPFWNFGFDDNGALALQTPASETAHRVTSAAPDSGVVDLAATGFRFVWKGDDGHVTAYILPGSCSDGMSDRRYGLHYIDDQGPRRGCCSL